MSTPELERYITNVREKGANDAEIKEHLLKSGWQEKDVLLVLSPKASPTLPPAPPPALPHFGMWVAFQYILMFISLYVSATALGGMMNYAVDQIFPDKLDASMSYYGSFGDYMVKWYVASMIIAFPIFAALFLWLKKQELALPIIRTIRVRKVLIYATLIITFLIMISNIISVTYHFIDGSITSRSLGHLVVTVLVAGSIFLYYLHEVKDDRKMQ